jgi:hypothetical protein
MSDIPSPADPGLNLNLDGRYHLYSIQLFAEAMTLMSRVLLQPREVAPRNELINTLHTLVSALSRQPRRVMTEHERLVALRALELLTVADESVNGPDTTEGRAKLYQLVTELKAL